MSVIIDNLVTLLQTLYKNIVYLIEKDSSQVQMHEYPIECIDKTHNIPTISTDTISNNQVIQNNVIEEDVLISFVTITLIWFIVAIIIILSATIISLIATNISFSPIKHNNNISTTSDLEKQALATIQEEGLTESDTD